VVGDSNLETVDPGRKEKGLFRRYRTSHVSAGLTGGGVAIPGAKRRNEGNSEKNALWREK